MGENGLLFKLKIGSEKERAGEAERESAPLESTFGVRDDGDFALFTSGNLSFFFSGSDFCSVDGVVFFLNWIFMGGPLGLGFEFLASLDLGCVLVVYFTRVGDLRKSANKI